MEVKKVVVGSLQTNCYLLINDDKCLIVDPGDEAEKIKEEISNKTVVGILITHHHFDHVGALNILKEFYQTKVYDYHNLKEGNYNIENFSFEVIYTLGHTDDSVTYYFKDYNIMFVGDFIFKGSSFIPLPKTLFGSLGSLIFLTGFVLSGSTFSGFVSTLFGISTGVRSFLISSIILSSCLRLISILNSYPKFL